MRRAMCKLFQAFIQLKNSFFKAAGIVRYYATYRQDLL